jgi:ribosomal protein S18 acetylase RimI-like enzyme
MKPIAPEIISKIPTQQEILFLEDRIYEHNAAQTNRHDGELFSNWMYDSGKSIVAGIIGWTWAGACEITLFWVKQEYRNKGYGEILLKAAEAEAKKKKCKAIILRTYSFQAPGFYQKYGYTVECETKSFPDGFNYFYLMKRLSE